jgi:hypothetical protein
MLPLLILGMLSNANAQTTLDKCTKAVDALEKETKLCDLALDFTKQKFEDQAKLNAKLLEEKTQWYSNPFVMLTLGAVAGLAAGAIVVGISK